MENVKKATFAGGCFWCMEGPFAKLEGVIDVKVGYMGGHKENPTYREVCNGETGHLEVVQVIYDSNKIQYEKLLNTFWHQIDPTDMGGQFADRGEQYKTAIFYHSEEQKNIAQKSKLELNQSGKFDKPIATQIRKAQPFYQAEDYHQEYYKTNSCHYKQYRKGSGREDYLKKTWANNDRTKLEHNKEEFKKRLTPLQYKITQECGTESPFQNEFWDHKEEGLYVDVVSGEPLFTSMDKFDSGTGWPSFTKPAVKENIIEKEDNSLFMRRTEVRSKEGDSHLGHVFADGPRPNGLRYCINSASLRFIPKNKLKDEGYEDYEYLFGLD